MDVPKSLDCWPGVKQILKITRTRIIKNKISTEVAYGITSLSKEEANSLKIMELWRGHWCIENQLHWVRDMVFDEDRCTIRSGNSPQIMAALRNLLIALACRLHKSLTDLRFECSRFHKRSIKIITEN
jgi:predicted transposase YbfD/YdcC